MFSLKLQRQLSLVAELAWSPWAFWPKIGVFHFILKCPRNQGECMASTATVADF